MKSINPDIPLYFYTSSHHHFYEGEMLSFSEMPKKPKRAKRAPRLELMGDIGRRLSLPVRGSWSVRAKFHNVPVALPPLLNACTTTQILSEHSYA